ncbi:hypothetical protein OQA88_5560 [Cercophora sp. LCS_1]
MSKTAVAEAESLLLGFTPLSDQVYVQDGPQGDADPSHPSTVIIYGWGDALPKHLAKYVEGYRTLFPHARMVLIFSPILRALYTSLAARTSSMKPVIEAVFGKDGEKGRPRGKILAHVASNTGGINYAATLNAHLEQYQAILPHDMLVLDSTPGSTEWAPNINRWSRALAIGAASYLPWPFVVTQSIAYAFLSITHFSNWVFGVVSPADFSVAAANDTKYISTSVRRLYLYSKEDDIIFWKDIEHHAAQAVSKGFAVDMELFEGTPHCGHARKHPEQYWGAIAKTWGTVAKGKGKEM